MNGSQVLSVGWEWWLPQWVVTTRVGSTVGAHREGTGTGVTHPPVLPSLLWRWCWHAPAAARCSQRAAGGRAGRQGAGGHEQERHGGGGASEGVMRGRE